MKDKIRLKMESHVQTILDKPIITNEEYMLISAFLGKLELEEQQEENKRRSEESNKRLKAMTDMLGNTFNS